MKYALVINGILIHWLELKPKALHKGPELGKDFDGTY
jgi:hypothetical protein